MDTLNFIMKKIPKSIRWIIASLIVTPIIGYILLQLITNKPIEISVEKIIYVIIIIISLSIIGYLVGSFRAVSYLLLNKPSIKSEIKPIKKILPYNEIVIGTYKTEILCSDIRAKIFLNESLKPNVDVFLERIHEGDPFCSQCSRPLDDWNASYMADFAQIGYKCKTCNTQIEGDWKALRNIIKGEVRKNYDKYWLGYKTQIDELTGGKPEEYEIPKY